MTGEVPIAITLRDSKADEDPGIRSISFGHHWDMGGTWRTDDTGLPPDIAIEDARPVDNASFEIRLSDTGQVVAEQRFDNPYHVTGISLQVLRETADGKRADIMRGAYYERTVEGEPAGFVEVCENGPRIRIGRIAPDASGADSTTLGKLFPAVGFFLASRTREGIPPMNELLENPLLGLATAFMALQTTDIEELQIIADSITEAETAEAKDGIVAALSAELVSLRRELQPKDLGEAFALDGGLSRWDAALAARLDGIGATSYADKIRTERQDKFPRRLWELWIPRENGAPAVLVLAHALWEYRVRPALERERAKEHEPARMSRDIATTLSLARAHGGVFLAGGMSPGDAILVEPPKGMALMLPLHGACVSKKDGRVVGLRQVLKEAAMRDYLATLVLYQDAGRREDGSFELLDGPDTILDVTGVGKRKDPKGRTGLRYASKDRKAVLAHLELFSQVRVRTVGDLEAVTGDPLLDEIRIRSTGKSVCYAHSRLIVGQLQGNYIQIPRAVCRLSARDVAIGMGIALVIRGRILAHLKKGTPIEAPIREWLEAAGIDGIERASKEGRRFWDEAVATLERVAEEGGLGQGTHHGTGPDIVFGIAPHQDLVIGYHPLLGAAKRQEGAKRQAMMVKQKEKLRG